MSVPYKYKKMKAKFLAAVLLIIVACSPKAGWTPAELDIIANPIAGTAPALAADSTAAGSVAAAPEILRVLTIEDAADSLVLRTPCADFTPEMLNSPEYASLARLMVATVTDPSEDGVGIAGPQVGISRRIVAVQRFDKPGEPFEVYPNVRIVDRRGELCSGPEGCLSVPGRRGNVLRYRDIDIQYTPVSPPCRFLCQFLCRQLLCWPRPSHPPCPARHHRTHPGLHRRHLPTRMRPPRRRAVYR